MHTISNAWRTLSVLMLCSLLLAACRPSPAITSVASSADPKWMVFQVKELTVARAAALEDIDGQAEVQMVMVFMDANHQIIGGYGYPSQGAIPMRNGQTVSMGAVAPAIDLNVTNGTLYVYVAVLDSDDTPYAGPISDGVGLLMQAGVALLTKGHSLTWGKLITEIVTNWASEALVDWVAAADLIDETEVRLNSSEHWAAGSPIRISATNTNARLVYETYLIEDPGLPDEQQASQPPSSGVYTIVTPGSNWAPPTDLEALIKLPDRVASSGAQGAAEDAAGTQTVKLPPMPYGCSSNAGLNLNMTVQVTANNVRVRTEPNVSRSYVLRHLSSGDLVTIAGGPECSDGYVWWYVKDKDGTGWVAETYLLRR
jgi:hypothetical protein